MVGARRLTLAEVAARAGVSASTASLAFSGAGPVAESTRARVLAAAAELGYAGPDPLARSLRQRRTGVVGVVIGSRLAKAFQDPVTIALLDGMSERLSGLGCGLLLLPAGADGADARPERDLPTPPDPTPPGPSPAAATVLAQVPVDALVFATCGADDDPLIGTAAARGIPVLGVEGPHRPGIPVVDLDQHAGSAAAARHLRDLGHREVAVVTLPLRADGRGGPVDADRRARATFAVARERLAGVLDVLELPAGRVHETPANLVEEGERAAAVLLATTPPPTAVIAQSDLLAIGVIRGARRAGFRVPEDLSVVGFDGIDTSDWLPGAGLTTVEQPMVRKGRVAGEMVAELLAGRTPATVRLPVRLRPGHTSAPPPPGGTGRRTDRREHPDTSEISG